MNISKLALLSLSIISPICAMQISNESLMVPHNLGKVKLYRNTNGFTLKQNKELHSIAKHDVDPLLCKANAEQLKEFLKAGYIKVKQANNGEFSLSSHTRGLGGGPVLAAVFYWGTKGICYGTAAAAAIFAATTVAPAAGVVAGTVAAFAAPAATTTAGAATILTTGAINLAALSTPAVAAATVEVTAATIAGGTVASTIAAVESASGIAGAIGMAIPWF
jgi:hypothetical protein